MSNNDDFWNELLKTAYAQSEANDFAGGYLNASEKEAKEDEARIASAVEDRLAGRALESDAFTSMRGLTDQEQAKMALRLPVEAGVRVQFASNAGAVLAYDDGPSPNETGIVVSVKSASGQTTSHNGMVFARWQDGKVRAIFAEHLRLSKGRSRQTAAAQPNTLRVASLGDLSEFLRFGSDTLVHKATKDLWKVSQEGKEFVLQRMFSDTGDPLKV